MEKNESTIEAAKRELEEESGLIAELSDLQKERLQNCVFCEVFILKIKSWILLQNTGLYIMQNTKGKNSRWGKKLKIKIYGELIKKGKEKRRKIT